jgi:hypothetical protein
MPNEYHVLKIDELARMGPMGGLEHYYHHTIKTRGGVVITVDIDAKDFTPEAAAPILLKAALNADKILGL